MDYMTKGISRKDLRIIAKWFRGINGTKNKLRFDSAGAFERFPSLFPNVTTEIVPDDDDSAFSVDSPGTCIPDMNGNYRILIREGTYDSACRGVGGPRSHLVHEMSHAILCMLGYTPVLERSFKNGEIKPCYRSMEWQAKALTGEIMVPYEETKGMTIRQIKHYCKVSKDSAEMRLKLDEEKKKKELPF